MDTTDRKPQTPPVDANGQPPPIREPQPADAPRQEAAGGHEESPIEEPGYGHGV